MSPNKAMQLTLVAESGPSFHQFSGILNDRYAPKTGRSDARIRGIVNGCL